VIGAVLVAATVYDVLTSSFVRHLTHCNAVRAVNDDNDDVNGDIDVDHNSFIADQRTPVFSTADDAPLILNPPTLGQRAIGSYILSFLHIKA